MPDNSIKILKQNILYAFNGHIMIRILRATYIFMLIRILSPEDYGLYQYSHVWFTTYTPITLMGLGVLLSLNVAKKDSDKELPSLTLSLRILTSCLLAALLYAVGSQTIVIENINTMLLLFVPILPIRALLHWGKEMCIAYEKMNIHFYSTTVFSIVQIAALIALEASNVTIVEITTAYVAILILEVLLLLIFVHVKVKAISLNFSLPKFGLLIKQSWLIAIVYMGIKFIVMSPILLSGHMETADIAILAGITMLIFFASLIIEATNNAALPFLSKEGISLKTMMAFWNAIKLPILTVAIISIILISHPSIVVSLLGEGYEPAVDYVYYIPLLVLLNFVSLVLINVLLVQETQSFLLLSVIAACGFLSYKYFQTDPSIAEQLNNAAIAFVIFILSGSASFIGLYLNSRK